MAGPYLFVSPLASCPAVCLLPLFHLCYHFSIHSLSPPCSLFGVFPETCLCPSFPLFSFGSSTFLLHFFPAPIFIFAALFPFLFPVFPSLLAPFFPHLNPLLFSPAPSSASRPSSPCSHYFSPSLFQAPPPHSPLSIIINDKG